jgi:hypothetical protein
MQGWVKLHRDLLDWEWYTHLPTKTLFIHLLLKANHKDNNYRGKLVKRGGLLTGRELLSKETGLSVQQIRTALKNLISTNEITNESTKQGSYIQIVRYDEYQDTTNESTNDQPTTNQQLTTNKNDKKEKNDKIYYSKGNLRLTTEEYNKLLESYSPAIIDSYIGKVENWKKASTVKSLYLTIINWINRESKKVEAVTNTKEVVSTGFNEHF